MTGFDNIALVLSGGSALGSYQAGAYQALHDHGIEPGWVSAASAGAINGAIICGNKPDKRLSRLEEFWQPSPAGPSELIELWAAGEEARRTASASKTLATGRASVFTPRRLFGPWWEPFGNREPASLYDTTPLAATLDRLVDFDLLNRGPLRFSAAAVDLESGADVTFDNQGGTITAQHLRASSALLPAFPPVEIDGRLMADGGLSTNLPLDIVLAGPPAGSLLCIALDLLPLAAPRPVRLGDAISRAQDLMFAAQSRRTLAAWQAIYDARLEASSSLDGAASISIVYLSYADQALEVSGKAFDFSPRSARARWDAGRRDLGDALDLLEIGRVDPDRPGLSVYTLDRGTNANGQQPNLRLSRDSLQPIGHN